jgi:hypothetical protein
MLILRIDKKNLYISTWHADLCSGYIIIRIISITLVPVKQNILCSSWSEKSFFHTDKNKVIIFLKLEEK